MKKGLFNWNETIATTQIDGFTYDDFSDWWLDNHDEDEEIPSDNSTEFYKWCADEANFNWECDMDSIKGCKAYNVPCVLTGCLGLWNGRPEIIPLKFDSVYDALQKIISNGCNSAYCDFDIQFNNGIIEVQHHHHDGTNCFEIRALTSKGIAKFDSAERNWKDVEELKKWDCKRLPYLYAM